MATVITITQAFLDYAAAQNVTLLKDNGTAPNAGGGIGHTETLKATCKAGYKFKKVAGKNDFCFTLTTAGDQRFYGTDTGDTVSTIGPWNSSLRLSNIFIGTESSRTAVRVLDSSDITDFTDNHAKLTVNNVAATSGMSVYTGDVLRAVADDGWKFQVHGTDEISVFVSDVSNQTYFKQVGTDLKLGSLTVGTTLGYFFVTTVAEVIPPTPIRTLDQEDIDVYATNHAKLYVNGVLAVAGSLVYANDVLSVESDSGWTFVQPSDPDAPSNAISAYWTNQTGAPVYFLRQGSDFTKGSAVAAGTIGGFFSTVVIVQPVDVKGFNNVYEINEEQLQLLARKRFVVEEGQPGETSKTVDYGTYILGLIDLPFKITPDMIVDQQVIYLGPHATDITASFLDRDNIRLSLGNIVVPGTKGNFLDYKNTVAMLHLPFSESVAIDLEYAIGQTISVEYIISLYNGVAVMNVTSSKSGSVIITQNVDMNISVPFANIQTIPTRNDPGSISLGGDNGIKTAFIEILRNDAVLENGFFTTPIVDESPLSAYTGFARIEDINLKSKANSYEKEMIESQLKNGVIIK